MPGWECGGSVSTATFGFGWDLQKHQPYRFIHSTRNSSCPGTLHGCCGVGVIAILVAGDAMRNAIFGVNNRHVSLTFVMAGSLFWVTAACLLVPIFWNMNSVLANFTIDFPPDFYLPSAPLKQEVGTGIGIGIGSGVLLILSGLLLMCNRYPKTKMPKRGETGHVDNNPSDEGFLGVIQESMDEHMINPVYKSEKL